MNDAYAPPSSSDSPASKDPPSDIHLTMVMAMLVAIGGALVAFGLFLVLGAALFAVLAILAPEALHQSPDDPPAAIMPVIALLESLFFLGPGTFGLASAWGIYQRKTWAWFTTLVCLALTLGGCCMPFGLYGLYALLRDEGRRAFKIG